MAALPRRDPTPSVGLPRYAKTPVMSTPEADFHARATRDYGERFLLGFNVSLYSLLQPQKGADTPTDPEVEARVRQMHVDCVFADTRTRLPVIVVELDDSSHNEPHTFERDGLKNLALASAGIPIVRLKYKHTFWSWHVNWTLAKALIDAKLKEAGY